MENLCDLRLVQGFTVQKFLSQAIQDVPVLSQNLIRLSVSVIQKLTDFLVHNLSHALGIVPGLPGFTAQERFAATGTQLHNTHFGAHAVLGHHLPGRLGGLLNVVRGTR